MKSRTIISAMAPLLVVALLFSQEAFGEPLHIDSVLVKSMVNSDSTWVGDDGVTQYRYSYDLVLGFKPVGYGKAQCFVEMSVDSGQTWGPQWEILSVLDSGLATPVECGTTGSVTLRVWVLPSVAPGPESSAPGQISDPNDTTPGSSEYAPGHINTPGNSGNAPGQLKDKKPKKKITATGVDSTFLDGVAFRIIGRQQKPLIGGDPATIYYPTDLISTPVPGTDAAIPLQVVMKANDSIDIDGNLIHRGFNELEMVYWDLLGDGTWDDSTTTTSMTWNTTVPEGTDLRKTIIVKARDRNQLWSEPITLNVIFGSPLVLRDIAAGTYQMGSTNISDYMADPPHPVTLSEFRIGSTPVTQELYTAIMGVNPSYFAGVENLPVESTTWFDAALFCNAMSKRAGLDTIYSYTGIVGTPGMGCTDLTGIAIDYTKHGFRLPTEAEWEYSCRATTTTAYFWGNSMNPDYCWYYTNSGGVTHPVAAKLPNSWGLSDMSGNVWEWCNDWVEGYTADAVTNPTGPETGMVRSLRGGSWVDGSSRLRSAYRNSDMPRTVSINYGFRVVLQ